MRRISDGRHRFAAVSVVFLCLAGGGLLLFWFWARPDRHRMERVAAESGLATRPATAQGRAVTIESQIGTFCGGCHGIPNPGSFPKSEWRKEVSRGFEFYRHSGRTDLELPLQEEVIAWFENRAPDALVLPRPVNTEGPAALVFQEDRRPRRADSEVMEIAHLRRLRLAPDQPPVLVYCDMFSGEIGWLRPAEPSASPTVLAWLSNPCHVAPCDLDGDGNIDLVAADLGSFEPADHARGRVLWLRQAPGEGLWDVRVLLANLGRVADVEPGDFDGDGDTDLVVAEFGWRRSGRILLLENTSGDAAAPKLVPTVLDSRHGAIHVPAADLNGDGRLDFVALISQEHEVIEAFLNVGDGTFRREVIYAAGDPAFGSTGIQVVDLDRDGDLDVLYTNGDSLDSNIPKNYHAVHWLENQGTYPFGDHQLTSMPGVSRALAGDLDGDGLPDVVAGAYLPESALESAVGVLFDSLIWLQQTAEHRFVRHRIETGRLRYLSLELLDADEDGALDIFAGNFTGSPGRTGPRISGWWNLRNGRVASPEGNTLSTEPLADD